MKNVLDNETIKQKLDGMKDWTTADGKKITKTVKFKNFKEALNYTNKVGEIAEEKQHHPDIYLTWGKVVIDITNHEAGGVTQSDFDLATAIDEI